VVSTASRLARSSLLAGSLAAGLLALAGCGSDTGVDGIGDPGPTHPGANELILRYQQRPGFVTPSHAFVPPTFSLYGDGRAIVADPSDGSTTIATLSDSTVSDLLAGAADLADQPSSNDTVMDAGTVDLTWTADGERESVTVSSVGEEIEAFRTQLLAAEEAASPKPWSPSSTAVIATSGAGGPAKPWPLGDLAAGDSLNGSTCSVLTGAKAVRASALVVGHPDGAWRSGQYAWFVAVVPLLPDQTDCADLT